MDVETVFGIFLVLLATQSPLAIVVGGVALIFLLLDNGE